MPTRRAARREALKRATGKRVRLQREMRGLTVTELAERAHHLPRQYVYDLEGGLRVTVRNTVAVARAMRLCLDWLLTGGPCLCVARRGAERSCPSGRSCPPSFPGEDEPSRPEGQQ